MAGGRVQSASRSKNTWYFAFTQSILVDEETAKNIAFSTARKHWGHVSTEMQMYFDKYGLDSKFVNERLSAFFYTQKGKDTFLSSFLHNIQ